MIQRRNQLQNDILSNNLNNPINMLGNNFAMMYNNSTNSQYFTNPSQLNNVDFRMNMPNSNFIYVDKPKKNQRTSQQQPQNSQQGPSQQQSQGSNTFNNNMLNVINLNSVINPNPYSNNLSNNVNPNNVNGQSNGNVGTGSTTNHPPKKEEKKSTTNTQNTQGGNRKK